MYADTYSTIFWIFLIALLLMPFLYAFFESLFISSNYKNNLIIVPLVIFLTPFLSILFFKLILLFYEFLF